MRPIVHALSRFTVPFVCIHSLTDTDEPLVLGIVNHFPRCWLTAAATPSPHHTAAAAPPRRRSSPPPRLPAPASHRHRVPPPRRSAAAPLRRHVPSPPLRKF